MFYSVDQSLKLREIYREILDRTFSSLEFHQLKPHFYLGGIYHVSFSKNNSKYELLKIISIETESVDGFGPYYILKYHYQNNEDVHSFILRPKDLTLYPVVPFSIVRALLSSYPAELIENILNDTRIIVHLPEL